MKSLMTISLAVGMILAISGAAQALSFDINGQPVTYTPYDGYYGHSPIITSGPSITLPVGASVYMDGTMANTGVQHFGFDLSMSSAAYLSGTFNDWLGLSFGQFVFKQNHSPTSPYLTMQLEAYAGNSVPTNSVNPGDLIMKFYFNGSRYDVGFAPGSYTLDFAFDNINNTTTLNISGGTTASKTWSGTMSVNSFDFMSCAWGYGQGSTVNVSNFVYGPVPEPSSIIALVGGLGSLLAFRKRKA